MTNLKTKSAQEMVFRIGEAMGLEIRRAANENITHDAVCGINDSFGFAMTVITEANAYYSDTNWIAWHTCSILEQVRYAIAKVLNHSKHSLFQNPLDTLCNFTVSLNGSSIYSTFLDGLDDNIFDYYNACSKSLSSIIEVLKPYAMTPSENSSDNEDLPE